MRRSRHSLSHYNLTTLDQGQLIPVACVETIPGDTFQHSTSAMLRVNPLVDPVMHPCTVRVHHWYVPNRIIWPDWETFISKKDPNLTVPTVTHTKGNTNTYPLIDHFGVPDEDVEVNALPIRAYNKIWNENYRDQDLQDEVDLDSMALQRVCWDKDYFTAARTEAQMGDAVRIPLIQEPVFVKSDVDTGQNVTIENVDGYWRNLDSSGSGLAMGSAPGDDPPDPAAGTMYVDLSQSTGIDVNEWRRAMGMQRLAEHRARFGSRYVDYLRSLGIRPSDSRVNEPEYLGGGRQQISFSEVLATSDGGAGNERNTGDMAGHGIAGMRTRPYRRFFEEGGHVITLAYVRPKSVYMNGLHKNWLRRTADEYWQKEYEGFGPQEVLRQEVFAGHGNTTDVFGYTDRHHDYRTQWSYVTGDFRNPTSNSWHLGREFESSPSLNASFVECVPTDRVYQDTTRPELWAMFNHRIVARRLVSKRPRY